MLDLIDTRIHDLHRRATGTDDRDPSAGQVERCVPPGGMNTVARERLSTGYVRPARSIEVAGSRDHHAGIADVAVTVAVSRLNLPLGPALVPAQALDLGAESGVATQTVLVGQRHQIGLVLGTLRVVARPFRIHLPR